MVVTVGAAVIDVLVRVVGTKVVVVVSTTMAIVEGDEEDEGSKGSDGRVPTQASHRSIHKPSTTLL